MKSVWTLILIGVLCACHTESPKEEPEPTPKEPSVKYVDDIPVERFPLQIANFKHVDGDPFFFVRIEGMTTDGERVLVWSKSDPMFLINADGIANPIGGFGEGPGDYNYIATAHVGPNGVYALDRRNNLLKYSDHTYVSSFRIKGPGRNTWPMYSSVGTDETLITEDFIITQTTLNGVIGEIATIYTHDGEAIGTITDPDIDESQLRTSPWSQRTQWDMADDRIFVLNMYWGHLLELDQNFTITKRHQLDSAVIQKYLAEYLTADDPERTWKDRSLPLFYDFQIYEGKGYATTGVTLHQIDLDTGAITRIYEMYAPDHPDMNHTPRHAVPYFAILNSGKIVMAHEAIDTLLIADFPPSVIN